MNVVVTGDKGFIGSRLKKSLEKRGDVVYGIDESIFEDVFWKDRLDELLLTYFPKCIFHVGACTNTLETDVDYMMNRNFDFTYGLALWCQAYNVPLIYSSSASIYGVNGLSKSLYAWSKYSGEALVSMCNGVSLRYFNVYGPGEEHKGKMASVFYQSWVKHQNGEMPKLFPLKPTRDFIYIDDVVEANIYACDYYTYHKGRTFDVGTANPKPFEEGLELMNIPYAYASANDVPNHYQFHTRASESNFLLNWHPKVSFAEGINKYINYLNNK